TLTGEVTRLKNIINNLRPDLKTNVGREADGKIVRSHPESQEVYISLGRNDHISPGLTFAVYDPRTGVRFDNDQQAAAKGGSEVMEVAENESLSRITQMPKGQTMSSGDLIANPVYQHDKNRKFRFVVIGDFDLDGDGVATAAEHDRLVKMITQWGGVIDDT